MFFCVCQLVITTVALFCCSLLSTDPSTFKSSSSNTVAVEGNSVTLYCNATGNPAPNITWTKDGSWTVLSQGEGFTINNITRQQAGNYSCTAWNGIGNKHNSTFAVAVHCKFDVLQYTVDLETLMSYMGLMLIHLLNEW